MRPLDRVRGPRRPLSRRQKEVLQCVASGYSRAEIAKALNIADPTVRTHMSRIFSALCAVNAANAVAIAYREGILPWRDERSESKP